MIRLGLERISRLFPPADFKFNVIHVAGTNGKGTVCFYAAHMLRMQGLAVGRFTSPHLIDRWDCVNIDGKPVAEDVFKHVEKYCLEKNAKERIEASSFEILTATAFNLFNLHNVDVGVIEVGVGGREDATNIIPQNKVLCSVITQIGLDHQSLLGNTIPEIASHKAGVIKTNVPCVYDSESPKAAVDEIIRCARLSASVPSHLQPGTWSTQDFVSAPVDQTYTNTLGSNLLLPSLTEADLWQSNTEYAWSGPFADGILPDGFLKPLSMASTAVHVSLQRLNRPKVSRSQLMKSVNGRQWPGRLQSLSLEALVKRRNPALLDGAHNVDSAARLGTFVARAFACEPTERKTREAVTWVLGMSAGKDTVGMLKMLLWPGDTLVTTKFGPVDEMPWVSPMDSVKLLEQAQELGLNLHSGSCAAADVAEAIQLGAESAQEGPLIIAGSLYLAADVLRLLKSTAETPNTWWSEWEAPVKLDRSLWENKVLQ